MHQARFTTRDECKGVIDRLVALMRDIGLEGKASLLVYGSYFGNWNSGASDLDGMLYLRGEFLRLPALKQGIRELYQDPKFNWLERESFFRDLFVLTSFFAADGRFLIFDRGFIDRMAIGRDSNLSVQLGTDTKHAVVWGADFLHELGPVALRHQDEFELAQGLHLLWNYLLFEIPKPADHCQMDYALQIVKFFKVLPRNVAIILREPMVRTPEELRRLRPYLEKIDYEPLSEIWQAKADAQKLQGLIRSWHAQSNDTFAKCVACYEQTLAELVKNEPMRSRKDESP